jgi:hypothetical protein
MWAQSASTGALTGTVTDPSGGVVPGASVTLVNAATGQSQTTESGSNGVFRFSLLAPGTYSVKVSAAGFKTTEVPSVVVNVTETPVVDAKMEVGETSQQVTVSGEAVTLQTENAAAGTLVDSRAMTAIPLTTRNYTQVLSLSSGVTAGVNNAGLLGRGTQDTNVNGNTTSSNNYQMNGGSANVWSGGTATDNGTNQNGGIAIPNPDAIAEFKIQTSQYDAGYGRNAGANVNVVTKGGGNDFHGTAFEFLRNDIFNANDFFRNAGGQPRPELKQNQFGGVVGGPILKNKLFFFGSYQGTRQINGLDSSSLTTLKLPPLTNDRSAATIGSEFCPANKPAPPSPAQNTQTFFMTAAGGTQVACNGSNINPVALNILQMKLPDGTFVIPTPQQITTVSNGVSVVGTSSFSVPDTFREDQFMVNTDYVISSKHTFSERYFYDLVPAQKSFSPTNNVPGSPIAIKFRDDNAQVKLTSVLTSNFVNEALVSYVRNLTFSNGLGVPSGAAVGMTPLDKFFPIVPGFMINGSLGSFNFFGNTGNDWYGITDSLQWGDQISWVRGKQTFRAGGFVQKDYWHLEGIGRARGYLTFNNFTDFLVGQSAAQNGSSLGQSNVFSISQGTAGAQESIGPFGGIQPLMLDYNGSAFFQDDIKVNSRLTLNLGIRWEYVPGNYDTAGKAGNFIPSLAATVPVPPLSGTLVGNTLAANYNPNLINPYTNQAFGPPPTGVVIRSTKTLYSNNAPLDDFGPRIGFAWQPGSSQSRLVIRGGYGWFFQTNSGNSLDTAGLTTVPFAQRFTNSGASANFATLQVPFPPVTLGYVLRTPSTQLSDVVGGPQLITPMVQQFSLNMQYEIVHNLVLEAGYIGSRGAHLGVTHGVNQPALVTASNPKINCGYDGVPADCIPNNTAANAKMRVPIMGETPTALGENSLDANSWYHALQTTLRKQFSHGLTFQVAYTYSKAESNTTFDNDLNNVALQWAPQNFDRKHRLVVNYIYDLPAPFKGEGFAGAILKGWSVSGVTTAQTGVPLTLTDTKGGTIYGNAGTSTGYLCSGASVSSIKTAGGNDQSRLGKWFDPTVLADGLGSTCGSFPISPLASDLPKPAATDYGNLGQGIVTGPGQFNWDISIGKMTRVGGIRENAQLQFRAEFYNAFNHPQFKDPGVAVSSSATFGIISASSVAPRLIQFGLKYLF